MAVTVTTDNYTELSTCNAASAGGTWSGGNALTTETDFYKYGTACLAYTVRQATTYQLDFSPTTAVDLSGTNSTIVRLWFLSYQQFASTASNGIRFYIDDGTSTAYWNVLGGDTYPGGWYMIVVDVSTTQTSGTKPTMTAVTGIGIDCTTTGTTKNSPSTFIDHLHLLDGLVAYGDNGTGVPFGISDIYDADNTTSTAWGAVKPVNDTWFINSSIEIGHSAGATNTTYEDADELFVYDGSLVTDFTFSGIEGTGATTFDLTRCVVKASNQPFKVDLSDTDVPAVIEGCSFINSGTIAFATNQTVTQSSFVSCGQVTPSASTFSNNVFTNYSEATTNGAMLWPTSGNVSNCTFINCDEAVEITQTTDRSFVGMSFDDVSGKYDVHLNNGGTSITVTLDDNSNANSYVATGGGVVTFATSSTLTLSVKDESGTVVSGANAYIDNNNITPFIMNTTTNASGIATVIHAAGAITGATWRVRKYGYKAFKVVADIPATGTKEIPVTLIADPQQT